MKTRVRKNVAVAFLFMPCLLSFLILQCRSRELWAYTLLAGLAILASEATETVEVLMGSEVTDRLIKTLNFGRP